jgi:predicted HTH domain antitoxin
LPPRFGKRFIGVIAISIEKGHLSVRRAAKLLDMSIDELAELCDTYKIARPFEL